MGSRDVINHLLFEVSTEVYNPFYLLYLIVMQGQQSRWDLLRLKIQSPSDQRRIQRAVYVNWVSIIQICTRFVSIACPRHTNSLIVEVEALDPPTEALQKTIESMQSRGVKLLYGRWLIEGAPRVLLFDIGSAWNRLDEWKGDLWTVAGIPAPPSDHETNETIVFGYLVAWFLGEV